MPERRLHRRWPRRIRVSFWRRDHPELAAPGYTADLSSSGAFVSTENPVGKNGRIQLQLASGQGDYLLEGVVARSLQVPRDLQKVKPGGMGVRFLRVDELVGELLNTAGDLSQGSGGFPIRTGPVAAHATEPAASETPFEVDLSETERFLRLWDQDIRLGGLFVETESPAPSGETVSLALRTPEGSLESRAKVVQVFEPRAGGGLATGMGVVLVDAEDLLAQLEALARRLRSED